MITVTAGPKNKIAVKSLTDSVKRFRMGKKRALNEVGAENRRHLRGLIRDKNKTGRLYTVRGRIHQASAPGEAPANLTGNLARSVNFKVRGTHEVDFGETAFYGTFLEEGTKNMAPRPHVKRTVNEKSKDNFNSFADRPFNALKGGR